MNNLKNVIKNNKDLIVKGAVIVGAAVLGAVIYTATGEEAQTIHWPDEDDLVDVEFEEFEVVNDEPTSEEK